MEWAGIAGLCRAVLAFATLTGAAVAHDGHAPLATPVEVDLALVLAVDVSNSVDGEENALQRAGYVAALSHPDIWSAIQSGPLRRIALAYVEWSGPAHQRTVVPWRLIDSAEAARRFAGDLAVRPYLYTRGTGTSISAALAYASAQFADSPFVAFRRVIDISGDGPNNRGIPVVTVRDAIIAGGVTVNGLPLMLRPSRTLDAVDAYYRDCVIGGPGAFVLPVSEGDDLALAIRRKLVLEIAVRPSLSEPADPLLLTDAAPVDCLIGERLRRTL